MSKYIRYTAPFESRVQSRQRWRRVYMEVRVSKWLLLSIACAVLLAAIALGGRSGLADALKLELDEQKSQGVIFN